MWQDIDGAGLQGSFAFDAAGIAAVVADVHLRYGGEERPFLTGWEAGGHTLWALQLRWPERWPERWRGVAPLSTNFRGRRLEPGISRHRRTDSRARRCTSPPWRQHGPLADEVLAHFA